MIQDSRMDALTERFQKMQGDRPMRPEWRKGKHWTPEEMKTYLWNLGMHLGRVPSMADIAPYHDVAVRLFGSISGAQRAAGFNPRRVGRPKKGEGLLR